MKEEAKQQEVEHHNYPLKVGRYYLNAQTNEAQEETLESPQNDTQMLMDEDSPEFNENVIHFVREFFEIPSEKRLEQLRHLKLLLVI